MISNFQDKSDLALEINNPNFDSESQEKNSILGENSIKKQKSKDDMYLNKFKNNALRSQDSMDSISIENFLDKEFLNLINSPSIVNIQLKKSHRHSRNSLNSKEDLKKTSIKKHKTFNNLVQIKKIDSDLISHKLSIIFINIS